MEIDKGFKLDWHDVYWGAELNNYIAGSTNVIIPSSEEGWDCGITCNHQSKVPKHVIVILSHCLCITRVPCKPIELKAPCTITV